MTRAELAVHCAREGMHWADHEHDGKKGVAVTWPNPQDAEDRQASFVPFAQLHVIDWPALRKHVVNGRDVKHFSRVVGYFSRIENWNPSKHGELKDRHKGDYGVGKEG